MSEALVTQGQLEALLRRLRDLERRLGRTEVRERPGVSTAYTPTYLGGTTPGTTTYVSQAGAYVRVGGLVYVAARVEWSAMTGTGEARLSLPFTAKNTANLNQALSSQPNNVTYSQNYLVAVVQPNTNYVVFRSPISNAAVTNVNVEAAGIMVVSGFYIIEA